MSIVQNSLTDVMEREPITEWWSIERHGSPPAPWIVTEWHSKRKADLASASMLERDSTILCIHRQTYEPTTERAESALPALPELKD